MPLEIINLTIALVFVVVWVIVGRILVRPLREAKIDSSTKRRATPGGPHFPAPTSTKHAA